MAKKNQPKRHRSGYNVNVWLPPAYGAAFEAYLAQAKPETDKTAVIKLALERLLASAGLWPPPPHPPAQ